MLKAAVGFTGLSVQAPCVAQCPESVHRCVCVCAGVAGMQSRERHQHPDRLVDKAALPSAGPGPKLPQPPSWVSCVIVPADPPQALLKSTTVSFVFQTSTRPEGTGWNAALHSRNCSSSSVHETLLILVLLFFVFTHSFKYPGVHISRDPRLFASLMLLQLDRQVM